MKQIMMALLAITMLGACKNGGNGRFTLNGNLKNVDDQTVFLEEMFFSKRNPEIVDSAQLKGGQFTLSSLAKEQGMYRVRLSKENTFFIFINDKDKINLTADVKNLDIKTIDFNTPANAQLKAFILAIDTQRKELNEQARKVDALSQTKGADSLLEAENAKGEEMQKANSAYIVKYIDTTTNAVMALFALGFTRDIDPIELEKPMDRLKQRFPNNAAIATMSDQFKTMMAKKAEQDNAPKPVAVGSMAPEITMPDTDDKPFSLSQLRGKYVLVDFWASWCGPCRGENPNVVKAYNKFKDKNFTILGVSLDKDKSAWVNAIQEDGLTWKQISDLKYWSSAATQLYGFSGIPYNVLVDPQGKIIAEGLRGAALEAKLASVLK